MAKKVNIKCAHCGDREELVEDSKAIPGVSSTYISAGEQQHLDSVNHAAEVMKKEEINKTLRGIGMSPHETKESATGRIDDFNHGKDHNA